MGRGSLAGAEPQEYEWLTHLGPHADTRMPDEWVAGGRTERLREVLMLGVAFAFSVALVGMMMFAAYLIIRSG